MPVLSKFYGIVIRMLFIRELNARFYAFYGESELVIGIKPLRIIEGEASERVRTLVVEWARQHQSELMLAWNNLAQAQSPAPIAPLV